MFPSTLRTSRRCFGAFQRAKLHQHSRLDEFIRLSLTRLEDRRVFDAAGLVADIMPGSGASNPQHFTEFAGSLYLSASGENATGQSVGQELFRLDADGRVSLVADINPGYADSNPDGFTLFDGALYFAAKGANGRELYRIDTAGTVSLVADIRAGTSSSDPAGFTPFDDSLYFAATGTSGRELYELRSNQTVRLVADIYGGSNSSNPEGFVEFDGKLYFAATSSKGRELFILNHGNQVNQASDINPGAASANPGELTVFNGSLYFAASSPNGRALFRQSSSGVNPVQIVSSTTLSNPSGFTEFEGHLYFRANNTAGGSELFRMNASENIVAVGTANNDSLAAPTGFIVFNDALYFGATLEGNRTLFRLDIGAGGIPVATPLALPPGVKLHSGEPTGLGDLQPFGGYLYFVAHGPSGTELYRADVNDNITLAVDINPGPECSHPFEFALFRGGLYFSAYQPAVGRELFRLIPAGSTLTIVGKDLVFQGGPGDEDNRIVISTDGVNLFIRDENGHAISSVIPALVGNGTSTVTVPLAQLGAINRFVIDTRAGDDSVMLDLSSHASAVLNIFDAIAFDGGTQTDPLNGDVLQVLGAAALNAIYAPDGLQSGKGILSVRTASDVLDVNFMRLESIDVGHFARAEIVAPITASGQDSWTVSTTTESRDQVRPALSVAGNSGTVAVASVQFFGNATLVINTNAGNDAADLVTVASATGGHGNGSLVIDTGTSPGTVFDRVNILGDVQLSGVLSVVADSIDVAADVFANAGTELRARHDVQFAPAGSVHSSFGAVRVIADHDRNGVGRISMSDGSLIAAGSGTIELYAGGDLVLSQLVSTNATPLAVTITSALGNILDADLRDELDIDVASASAVLTMSAFGSVGASNDPLSTNARNLVVVSGGSQFLDVAESIDSLRLDAGSAGVYLNAGGSILDSDSTTDVTAGQTAIEASGSIGSASTPLQVAASNVEASAGGSIYVANLATTLLTIGGAANHLSGLTAGGELQLTTAGPLSVLEQVTSHGPLDVHSIGDLSIAAHVTSGGGPLDLTTGGSFVLSNGASVTSGGGAVTVSAVENIVLAPGTSIAAGIGDVTLTAGGSATLSAVSSLGLAQVTAGGSIVDGDPGGTAALIAGQAALQAGGSIGAASTPLQVAVSNLEASAGAGIYLANIATTLLTIGGVLGDLSGLTAGGELQLTTAGPLSVLEQVTSHGPLSVFSNGGAIIAAEVNSYGGSISLQAVGNLTATANVTSGGGPLDLTTGGSFVLSNGASVTSGGGAVTVSAMENIVLAPGTSIAAGVGDVTLTAGGSATLSAVSSLGLVTITAGGSIIDNDSGGTATLIAGQAALQAGGSIGSASTPLQVAVSNLEASAGAGIYLANLATTLLTIGGAANYLSGLAAGGELQLTTAGPLSVVEQLTSHGPLSVFSNGGAIIAAEVNSHGGSISLQAVGNLTATANVTSGGGSLGLTSGGSFVLSNGASVTSGGGAVTVSAMEDIVLAPGTSIAAGVGDVTLTAGGSATLSAVSSLGLVQVTAGGSIIDNDSGGTATLIAGQAALQAGGSIGSVDKPLQIAVSNLKASATGDIYLDHIEAALLTVNSATANSISIATQGPLLSVGPIAASGTGSILLDATTDLTLVGSIDTLTGSITLLAGHNLAAGTTSTITSSGGNALLQTGGSSMQLGGMIDLDGGTLTIVVLGGVGNVHGTIAGIGGLIKHGPGRLTLESSGDFVYSGLTSVMGGTLLVNGALTGDVTISSGGKLAGNGSIAGSVTALAGALLAPGDGTGVLHVGQLVLQPEATLEVELHGITPGSQYDQIVVAGTVQFAGAILIVQGGQASFPKGTSVVFVVNNGESAAFGPLVDANQRVLTQGSEFTFGGTSANLIYDAGSPANDVGLFFERQTTVFFFTDLGPSRDANADSETIADSASSIANSISSGIGGALSDAEQPESRRTTQVHDAEQANLAADSTSVQSVRLSSFENAAQTKFRLFFRIYNDALEQEGDREYPLPVNDLSDVLGVFRRYKFPNGHYRIYVQEAGARVERLLLDVHVYEGKVVPEGFREEDAKPAENGRNVGESPPAADTVPENQPGEANDSRLDESSLEPSQSGDASSGAATLGGLVVGTSLADRQRQIHAALASGRRALSRTARRMRAIRT